MLYSYIQLTKQRWLSAYEDRHFRFRFVLNFFACLFLYFTIVHWLHLNSSRIGATLNDPIQPHFIARDWSVLIGILTYASVIPFLVFIAQQPRLLHQVFRSFTAVFVVRAVCIWLVPLAPPKEIIALYDPVIDYLAGEGSILNDLFFSGHVADLFIFFFAATNLKLKQWIFICTIFVGTLLVWQRVHYTIDVFAAPFFAWVCHRVFIGDSKSE